MAEVRKKERKIIPQEEKLSGTTGTADIVCPFFCAHAKKTIRCKDIYPWAESVTMVMKDEKEKGFHMDCYCKRGYKKCWLYCCAMKLRWDDMGE